MMAEQDGRTTAELLEVFGDSLFETLDVIATDVAEFASAHLSEIESEICNRRFLYRARVNAYRESPAPTTTNCRPSSMNVDGPLAGFA